MKISQKANPLIASVVAIVILATPLLAQQNRNPPRKPVAPEPVPTFDSLLAANSFKVYCEIRGVGGLIRSPAINDLLEPLIKLGDPPKEFKAVVKWLDTHADALAGSRMMVTGWASRPNLPNVLIAIEFSSPEEAKKFYPQLNAFLPKLLPTPAPTPSPTTSPSAPSAPAVKPQASSASSGLSGSPGARTELIGGEEKAAPHNIATVADKEPESNLPQYQIKQAGSLVLISDLAFTFPTLRPRGSKPLEEDPNFLLARNRFASESVFLYVDVKSIEKEEREQRQKWEEEAQKRAEAEATRTPEPVTVSEPELSAVQLQEQPNPAPDSSPYVQPIVIDPAADAQPSSEFALSNEPQPPVDAIPDFYSLYGMLFGGENKWPEAIGAALVFEGDAYVVRTLIINSDESKGRAIPFVPQFISGPAIAPASPNVFPADVDLFVTVSLDYPQIYEGMLKAFASFGTLQRTNAGSYVRPEAAGAPPETPFASYEKKLGLKIKDDLLPLLGNELALALPRKVKKTPGEPATNPPASSPASPGTEQQIADNSFSPMIAIAVKDREAVGRLISKIIEGFGLKGASRLAQTEKRDGAEIVSYGGLFSYAFVDEFLVLSPNPAETRHVVDAYVNHQTLSSDSHFRNSTRWQPRQVLGQVYMAPRLVAEYTVGSGRSGAAPEKASELLAGVNPVIDPLTYSLSNDGLGPLHELHVPKNLLQLVVTQALVGANESLPSRNEAVAKSIVRNVASAEATFRATDSNNGYGTIDQLVSAGLLSREMLEKYGYRIDVSVSADKFQITAVPIDYGTTGKLSFFIDESQILRGGDHGGGAATADDQPI